MKPLVVITMGDPAGIGPEIILKAFSDFSIYDFCRPFVSGDIYTLKKAMHLNAEELPLIKIRDIEEAEFKAGTIEVLEPDPLSEVKWGKPDQKTGRAMVDYILKAVDLCLEKKVSAMVTGPINKYSMNLSGYPYNGHTELLAERCNTEDYVMMLAGEKLKVSLVTIHAALRKVPSLITEEKILSVIRVSNKALKERFGIKNPLIALAALNPHAGEEGMFGDEEEKIINPAIKRAVKEGINVKGAFPSDTLFYYNEKEGYDAVIAMYHDQGLIPFKMLHFEDGVNTTLGLPIIRTSVDHGTAYDIAGKGIANEKSLIAAIKMAAQHAVNIKNTKASGNF